MRKSQLFILALVVFSLTFTSTFADRPTTTLRAPDPSNYSVNLLQWPNQLTVKFEDGVSEREKEVTHFAIEIARKEFEQYGLDLVGDVYITSNRNTYMREIEDEFGHSYDLFEYPDGGVGFSSKGIADSYTAKIFINLDLIRLISLQGVAALDSGRHETHLMYVIVHEFGHVLQERFSLGWRTSSLAEYRSNLMAEKGLTLAFCRGYVELYGEENSLELEYVNGCDVDSAIQYLINLAKADYKTTGKRGYALTVYFLDTYGYDAFNELDINMLKCAEDNFLEVDTIDEYFEISKDFIDICFEEAFKSTFGKSPQESDLAIEEYIKKLK